MNALFESSWLQYVAPPLGVFGAVVGGRVIWKLVGSTARLFNGPLSLVRAIFSLLLLISGVVVAMLFTYPDLLTKYVPDWRESAGWLLLCVTMLGIGVYFIRLFKTAAMLCWCIIASVVLGCQLAFSKMPYDLGDEECRSIERALPASLAKGMVGEGVRRIARVGVSTRDAVRSATSAQEVDS